MNAQPFDHKTVRHTKPNTSSTLIFMSIPLRKCCLQANRIRIGPPLPRAALAASCALRASPHFIFETCTLQGTLTAICESPCVSTVAGPKLYPSSHMTGATALTRRACTADALYFTTQAAGGGAGLLSTSTQPAAAARPAGRSRRRAARRGGTRTTCRGRSTRRASARRRRTPAPTRGASRGWRRSSGRPT